MGLFLRLFSPFLAFLVLVTDAGACSVPAHVSLQGSYLVAQSWRDGTNPVIGQLKSQGVDVKVESTDRSNGVVTISKFPGYEESIYIYLDDWTLIPEFQILLLAKKANLPAKVTFGEKIIVTIGSIEISLKIGEDRNGIINYLGMTSLRDYYYKINYDAFIFDIESVCPQEMYFRLYCFSKPIIPNLNGKPTVATIKNLWNEANNEERFYTINFTDSSWLKSEYILENPRKYIVFLDTFEQFLDSKPTKYLSYAIVQRMTGQFENEMQQFEVVKMPQRVLIGVEPKKYGCDGFRR